MGGRKMKKNKEKEVSSFFFGVERKKYEKIRKLVFFDSLFQFSFIITLYHVVGNKNKCSQENESPCGSKRKKCKKMIKKKKKKNKNTKNIDIDEES